MYNVAIWCLIDTLRRFFEWRAQKRNRFLRILLILFFILFLLFSSGFSFSQLYKRRSSFLLSLVKLVQPMRAIVTINLSFYLCLIRQNMHTLLQLQKLAKNIDICVFIFFFLIWNIRDDCMNLIRIFFFDAESGWNEMWCWREVSFCL